ncbi:MAG TPA: CHASE2 domain-containing protein [Baekduia sp.]|nr:CHASE2 domain-containing protein [Baekduia sp.]
MSTTGGPYIGLDYFVEEDAGLFFGRDSERKRIIGNLRASRLTLLYAESGVGKSSLLRAGVSARIRQLAARSITERGSARYVPVVFSAWRDDPTRGLIDALEAAVDPLLGDGDELALRRDALEHAIEDVAAAVDATPLLILDQFEDHFLYEPDADGFDQDLARCVNRRDLRANFLISVREDAYSLVGPRFKARIPNIYGNYLHLDFLDERAAREAVFEPVRAFNERLAADEPRFEVETALVDAVLEQVRRGRVSIGDGGAPDVGAGGPARVETAYLQLVMKRLWDEEVAGGSQRLRLETLRRLGGADTIVRGHLDDVMAELPADQRDAAAAAFRFLVTSSGRKIALSSEELREFSETDAAPLEPALKHLERERILRPIPSSERDGVARHEIYHDVLAPAIREWRRRHVEEQRSAETEQRLAQAGQRARRLEVRSRRLAAAVIALAAVAIGLALYLWDPRPVQRLELGTVDARFSVRGSGAVDPRLVMIAVDDKTLERFDTNRTGRLPRAQYARMLDRLRQDRPTVIALDVIFQDALESRGDRALLAAFRATRDRLVLAYRDFAVVQRIDGTQAVRANLLGRPDAVRRTGAKTGFAGLPQDVDDSNRRADYLVDLVPDTTGTYESTAANVSAPTFAFAAADLARGGALSRRVDALPAASRRASGGQSQRTTWIDYRGPPGTVRRVSALDVLEGRVAPGAFRDKLVVIGVTTRASTDVHRTPLDAGRGMPGAEVQANAIDTMLRGEPLRDASSLINILAIILLACLPAVAALTQSRRVTAAAITAVAIVFLAAAQLAFHAGWIVAVIVPLAALVAAMSAVAVLVAAGTMRPRMAGSRSRDVAE